MKSGWVFKLMIDTYNEGFNYITNYVLADSLKEDFNSFERYNYIGRTSLGELTGEILVEEALKMTEENPG